MQDKSIKVPKTIFFILVGIFVLIVLYFAIPFPHLTKRALFPYTAILAGIFLILGITLVVFTIKKKIKGYLKLFLLLTGFSASAFLVSILLHNFVYGLFIYFFGEDFWERIGLMDEPFFFILGIIVCPIVFLIGMIGSIVMFARNLTGR